MSLRQWVEPSRRLLVLFVAVIVTIGAAPGWLGWSLLDQDRDLSRQWIQERLDGAADLASAMLAHKLSEAESSVTMSPVAEPKSEDALTVVFALKSIEARPAARLSRSAPQQHDRKPTARPPLPRAKPVQGSKESPGIGEPAASRPCVSRGPKDGGLM